MNQPTSRNSPPTDPTTEATRLLALWRHLGRTHMMAAAGCACGSHGVAIVLTDFEQDIADYLYAETERVGYADVRRYLEDHAREGQRWSIDSLLSSICRPPSETSTPDDVAVFILERLSRTLHSFEALHS